MKTRPVFLDEDARHFYGQTLLACGLARRRNQTNTGFRMFYVNHKQKPCRSV